MLNLTLAGFILQKYQGKRRWLAITTMSIFFLLAEASLLFFNRSSH
ncbi:MAG TPA: hypothetical protein PKX93_07605 [bacterium]|nr:hypothetical protein [bacterium]HPP11757.1 hypothetical protein [bacterium]